MALTNQQLLDAIETAISSILEGGVASYQVNGRAVTKLDLPMLLAQRTQLLLAVQRESTGMFVASQFRRPE
jgi:hypothetical protein